MYASSADESAGLLVGVHHGPVSRDDDYERAIASILACDTNAVNRGLVSTCVMVTDADTPPPPPIWRQRMANANNKLVAERYYFAFVSPKLLIRGVFTAVTWLTRQRPGHHLVAFSDLAQASQWIEGQTGLAPLAIRRLYDQALQRAKSDATTTFSARTG